MTKSVGGDSEGPLGVRVGRADLRRQHARPRDVPLVGQECRDPDHVGQTALNLRVTDEDAAGATDHPVDEPRLFQRGKHLAQARSAGSVALRELAFAAELGARHAIVDVRHDPAPQLLGLRGHRTS